MSLTPLRVAVAIIALVCLTPIVAHAFFNLNTIVLIFSGLAT